MMKWIAGGIWVVLLLVVFVFYVTDGNAEWNQPDIIIPEEVVTTKPTLKLNLEDRAPVLEFVSATEYTKGDGNGSTIVKLIDWKGDKINTTCWELILYPDKTIMLNWTLMTQHWEYGNYYKNFVVPEPLGIYDQEVRCIIGSKNVSIGKGFHVGNLSGVIEANNERVDIMSVMS